MAWFEEADEIREDIAELRAALNASGVGADARVTALAAIVNAKAVLLAIETFYANRDGIVGETIRPLTLALGKFPEAANGLASGLRRLPDR
jgi:hypothetical protein